MDDKEKQHKRSKRIAKSINWKVSNPEKGILRKYFIVLKNNKGHEIKRSHKLFKDDFFDITPNLYDPKNACFALGAIRGAASISNEYKRWIDSNSKNVLLKSNGIPSALDKIIATLTNNS